MHEGGPPLRRMHSKLISAAIGSGRPPHCTDVAGEAYAQHEEGGAAPDRELPDKAPSCLTGSSTACRMYSELISAAIGSGGPHAARTSQVKLMRSVKKVALRLIETFVDKAEDTAVIAQQFVPAMMDPILGDYARNVPDARWASLSPQARDSKMSDQHG